MAGLCSVPWGWRRQAQNRLYTLGGARTGGDLFSPQPHSRPSALGGAGQKGLPAPAGAAATGDLAAGEGPGLSSLRSVSASPGPAWGQQGTFFGA